MINQNEVEIINWNEVFGTDSDSDVQKKFIPPKTKTEKHLAEIWAKLLNFDKVSMCDNFLDLGGHSLLINIMFVKINKYYNLSINYKNIIFDDFTIENLANKVEELLLNSIEENELENIISNIKSKG